MNAYTKYWNGTRVAFLWIASYFLPFLLVPGGSWVQGNTVAALVFLFFAAGAVYDTIKGIRSGSRSDVLVFAAVPIILLGSGFSVVWIASGAI